MKKVHLTVLGSALCCLFACNKAEKPLTPIPGESATDTALVSKQAINHFVAEELKSKGRFNWAAATPGMLRSALLYSDSILTIGYQPAGFRDLDSKLHLIDINSAEWKDAKAAIIRLVEAYEQVSTVRIAYNENRLPVIDVKVTKAATIKALRASALVRYAEPGGYGDVMNPDASPRTENIDINTASGCGNNNGETGILNTNMYKGIFPGARQSWNYAYHKIDEAWAKTTGSGVKVMIIDTGVSDQQDNLGSAFNQGASGNRTIEKKVTRPNATPNDACGHGTEMASVCAAPRGTDSASTGVAYNASLMTVHATDDVFISGNDEIQGVSDAFTMAGDDSTVKIVSMSMGTPFESGKIKDAVIYARNKGKLIFCAAGTSTYLVAEIANALGIGVVFPAYMNEVVAVTGIKDNLQDRCDACHTGTQVRFVVVMERSSDGKHPLSLAMSGDVPSTVGGSSVATSTCAGIAALVWSRYPADTRDQILARMDKAGSLYLNKSDKYGYGVVDAKAATLADQ
ncbi:S8 family peptidase [Chitinophaga vietnamensis]|uniref:S8 family peptidase n=1 Tax=Chitinophaga vietnamensis TaxID=2593957 RepID=UPI001178CB94|nr:S8 family serine peptidase [Chitinophaga vietnamensis]